MRSIDMALDAFFGAFDYARLSTQRAEAIAMENNDVDAYTEALQKINALWGAELKIKTMNDVKAILQKPNRTGCLEW